MDRLWAPWRQQYLTTGASERMGVPAELAGWPGDDTLCVFCNMLASVAWAKGIGMAEEEAERSAGIVLMGEDCYVCLNAFPYSSGHLLLLPYSHTASLETLPSQVAVELIRLAQRAEGWLRSVYQPDGLNFGMNLGEAAGAGIAGHLHLHGLPRWLGDGNFMTTVAETRVMPEALSVTWQKLRSIAQKVVT